MSMCCVRQSEEIFLDMFEDEYREMTVSTVYILYTMLWCSCLVTGKTSGLSKTR